MSFMNTIYPRSEILPSIEVDVTQFHLCLDRIKHQLGKANFLAIDAEFSGLGLAATSTKISDLEERYKVLRSVAIDYSLISLGLSLFERDENLSNEDKSNYLVSSFNLMLNRRDDYKVTPRSLTFLIENGLDIREQLLRGIPYVPPGNPIPRESNITEHSENLRDLFLFIINQSNVSLILHNGLLDLMFLYHHLFNILPETFHQFVADVSVMFPGGIYDTKFICEYLIKEKASFLGYVYRKYERKNWKREQQKEQGRFECRLHPEMNVGYDSTFKEVTSYASKSNHSTSISHREICHDFAKYGACRKGKECTGSHNIDQILDFQENRQQKRNKRRRLQKDNKASKEENHEVSNRDSIKVSISSPDQSRYEAETSDTSGLPISSEQPMTSLKPIWSSSHISSHDAYMTGFVFASLLSRLGPEKIAEEAHNRIYLMGQQTPLYLMTSAYSRLSSCVEHLLEQRENTTLHQTNSTI